MNYNEKIKHLNRVINSLEALGGAEDTFRAMIEIRQDIKKQYQGPSVYALPDKEEPYRD